MTSPRPLVVSSSPHLHSGDSTRGIMLDVLIALLPATAASVLLFGWRAAALIVVCIAACLASEILSRAAMRRPQTVGDLSAAVTGLLLALNLPPTLPLWQAAFGSVVAIVVAKQLFGGLGQNFVNPALAGRLVLLASFPATMNNWIAPAAPFRPDAISSATPLALTEGESVSLTDLFLGTHGGSLGETCALALLLGGVYLVVRRVISPRIPLAYIGTVAVFALLAGENPLVHVLSGGLLLGAIFMATDYVTSPITPWGKIVYGVGCGLLTMLIRLYGSLPEGVSFAIVIMNILTPLIERATRSLPFGETRRRQHDPS